MLLLLDIFFTVLHLAIVGFNLTGWIWQKTRKAHLVCVAATAASWFLLGIWFGWGYCFLTDWHWDVKEKSGETNLPNSFIKYLADKLTGCNFSPPVVDAWTLGLFLAAIALSVYVNFFRKKK
jgi:hypothetical protein